MGGGGRLCVGMCLFVWSCVCVCVCMCDSGMPDVLMMLFIISYFFF